MIENAHVETASFIWLIVGAVLWIAAPVALQRLFGKLKKGPVPSILIGAAAFIFFDSRPSYRNGLCCGFEHFSCNQPFSEGAGGNRRGVRIVNVFRRILSVL